MLLLQEPIYAWALDLIRVILIVKECFFCRVWVKWLTQLWYKSAAPISNVAHCKKGTYNNKINASDLGDFIVDDSLFHASLWNARNVVQILCPLSQPSFNKYWQFGSIVVA